MTRFISALMHRVTTTLVLGVLGSVLLVLQGCGGSDGPPPNANPKGYYGNNGTATVNADTMSPLMITDMQGVATNNRIVMMSAANNLLYDGTITSITNQTNFTATFTIYDNGQNPITATATGTITQGSSITGTLTGTGLGNGTFTLTYSLNNSPAALTRIANAMGVSWQAIDGSANGFVYVVLSTGMLVYESGNAGTFTGCEMSGAFVPVAGVNAYTINVTVTGCKDAAINNTNYTGVAALRSQLSTDDRMFLSVSNGTYSLYAEYQHFL